MTIDRKGMRLGLTAFAFGLFVLALPAAPDAQRAAGTARVGWLEVCDPGPRRPHFDIFRTRLAELGSVEGTNLVLETTELSPKRLELLKEAVPRVSRVMFLHDPDAAPTAWKLSQEAAPRLGIKLQAAPVGAADELTPELAVVAKERTDAKSLGSRSPSRCCCALTR